MLYKSCPKTLFFVVIVVSLLLSSCGTFEISLEQTATPDMLVTEAVDALVEENSRLATQVASQTPSIPPLSMQSASEEIRLRMLDSYQFWQTLWADAQITYFSSDPSQSEPVQVSRVQAWIEQPDYLFRILIGATDQRPEQLMVSDGSAISRWDLAAGQEEVSSISEFDRAPYNPARSVSDTVTSHPMAMSLGTPLNDALFPSSLAQRGGEYHPVRPESAAGREALVVDWYRVPDQRVDRFWLDTKTGIVLRWQNFSKAGGERIETEISIQSIVYDVEFPPDAFARQIGEVPQFAQDYLGTPGSIPQVEATPADEELTRTAGELYFIVLDKQHLSLELVRVPGVCILQSANCPPPETVAGYPNRLLSRVDALTWSRDGKQALVVVGEQQYGIPSRLYRFQRESGEWFELAEAEAMFTPVWSPDGDWVAAIARKDGIDDVMVLRPDGSDARNLTQGELSGEESQIRFLVWTQANQLLVGNTHQLSTDIYQYDPQSGEKTVWMQMTGKTPMPVISPQADRVVTITSTDTGSSIGIQDMQGSEPRMLASFQSGIISNAIWSADGTKIAFVVSRVSQSPGYQQDVYVLNADGTGLQQVFTSLSVLAMVWGRDAQDLVISAENESSSFYLYHADLGVGKTQILPIDSLRMDLDWISPSWAYPTED